MDLLLKRIAKKSSYTIGHLYVNGEYLCDTIEDKDRGLTQDMKTSEISKIKVKTKTAIPTGTYNVTLKVRSPKFGAKAYYAKYCKGYLPRLLDVPGFEGILMHRGVDENSSSGCIILGYNTVVGKVTNSQKAFEALYSKLRTATDGIKITIQ